MLRYENEAALAVSGRETTDNDGKMASTYTRGIQGSFHYEARGTYDKKVGSLRPGGHKTPGVPAQ